VFGGDLVRDEHEGFGALYCCQLQTSLALVVKNAWRRVYHAQCDRVRSSPRLAFHEEAWDGETNCCDDQDGVDDVHRSLDARVEDAHCWEAYDVDLTCWSPESSISS
jgi:hypothetical protein